MKHERHILLVGATSGMGKSMAEELFKNQKCRVSILGRKIPSGHINRPNNIHYYPVDLSDISSIRNIFPLLFKDQGEVDGCVFFQRYRDGREPWKGEIDVSLTATKEIIENIKPFFNKKSGGSIVMVGSMADQLVVTDCSIGYHLAKAGLRQMARYYAVMLAPLKIRVNCVTPGMVLKKEAEKFYFKNKKLLKAFSAFTPLGKMVSPFEVVDAISFFLSPKSSFITGQNLVVDGGLSLVFQGSLAKKWAEGGF
ncbi:MAG: NAD-dependent glycerol dehydrogenase [Elusimicrobia bacterium]|nr:NAD-dependent glycerol dehydrogenase [Elusimicrobiota bacterium]